MSAIVIEIAAKNVKLALVQIMSTKKAFQRLWNKTIARRDGIRVVK
jgi:hypothetical protein